MIQTVEIYKHLRVRQFRHWLEDQDNNKIIGKSGDACDCPLANYLTDVWPLEKNDKIVVNQLNIHVSSREPSFETLSKQLVFPIPSWMNKFVDTVDQLDMILYKNDCIEILRKVEVYDK